jgi:hypothetical protein
MNLAFHSLHIYHLDLYLKKKTLPSNFGNILWSNKFLKVPPCRNYFLWKSRRHLLLMRPWALNLDYRTTRAGSAKNNSKNRCQNFREIIFSKNIFFVWWKQESSRIILFLASAETNFLKINKYSAWKYRPCPTGTVYNLPILTLWHIVGLST